MRRLLAVLLGAALIVAAPQAASAHTGLRDGSPGPGDEVASGGRTVALVLDGVDPDGEHTIALLDSEEAPLPVGVARASSATLVCASVEPMRAGIHTVEYSVTSADGHVVRGRYLFEVTATAEEPEELGCGAADLPAPQAAESLGYAPTDAPGWVLWTVGALVLVSGAVAGAALVRSRREP